MSGTTTTRPPHRRSSTRCSPRVPAELIARVRARVAQGRRGMREEPDAGYSTEAVLVTALLVVLAIGVVAIIAIKVSQLANGITFG